MKTRRKQTAVKGRFSAMFISAAVHIAVLIAAGTFVAVTVVQRQEARFEGQQMSRPRMQLQRLQVPQRARQERQAPQMSQRVTAQAGSTRSVDFQMPEIAGLGGGIQVDMSGAGFTGGLGFATPQINLQFEPLAPIANTQAGWIAGLSYALRNNVDTVYWLGADDRINWIYEPLYHAARRGRPVTPPSGQPPELEGFDFLNYPGGEQRWNQLVERARRMYEEENARRLNGDYIQIRGLEAVRSTATPRP